MPSPSDQVALTRRTAERLQEAYRLIRRLEQTVDQLANKAEAQKGEKGQPIAFAKTRAGDDGYPADLDPADYLVYEIEFVDRRFFEGVGGASVTSNVWTKRFRKACTLKKTKGFPVGTLCLVYRIGRRLYIEPIADSCRIIPALWSDVEGWDAGARQFLSHAPDECPKWVSASAQECPETP